MSVCNLEAKMVRMIRREKNLTIRGLNIQLGLPPKSKLVLKIEKGDRGIPTNLLLNFSEVLGVSLKVLVDLKVKMYRDKLEGEVHETILESR